MQELADALEAAIRTDYVRDKLKELKVDPLFLRGQPLDEPLSAREADFRGAALPTSGTFEGSGPSRHPCRA